MNTENIDQIYLVAVQQRDTEEMQRIIDEAAHRAERVKIMASFPQGVMPTPRKSGDWVSLDTVDGHNYQTEYAGEAWRENSIFGFVPRNACRDAQTGWAAGQTLILLADMESADPILHDQDGNIIMPSQRFPQ